MKKQTLLIALALALPAGSLSAQAPEGAPPGPREGAPGQADRPRGDRPEGGPNQRDRTQARPGQDRPEGGGRQPGGPEGGPRPEGGPEGGGRMPRPPIIAALDANNDGEISADEIAQSNQALKKLDKNADGKLTMDELMPRMPRGGGSPDGDRSPFPPRGGPRDGEGPGASGPRDGERPARTGPRDGENPRPADRPRDGERPREGERPRQGDRPPDGERLRPEGGAPRRPPSEN